MLTDRYGQGLTTASEAARDAYVRALDLTLTMYPGSIPLYDQALSIDPGFALAHAGKARAFQLKGDIPSARAAIAEAQSLAGGLPDRERGQIAILSLLIDGQAAPALDAVRRHVEHWPLDSMIVSTAANQNGLIGTSCLAGRTRALMDFLAVLAPHYGNDWWFNGHYAMALAECGFQTDAAPLIERSMTDQPHNAMAAHAQAHVYYETGQAETAARFLQDWLAAYPRDGGMYGHLHWHLALVLLQQGDVESGFRLFTDAFGAEDYPGLAMVKLLDSASFLWRAELAGHPRDRERWGAVHEFARRLFPNPGMAFVDWHVAIADAVIGPSAPAEARTASIEALVRQNRYAAGPTVAGVAHAFAAFEQGDYPRAIATIEPIYQERERLCGSQAQLDLVEFTLLTAYLRAGDAENVRRLMRERRPGPASVPVAGVEAINLPINLY
jgi:tetratricopeptide (TPR) repeat protein